MESNQKMAIAGSGLIAAGIGLGIIGAALIVPAAFSLADGLEKRLGPWLRKGLLTYEPEHRDIGHMHDGPESGVQPAE